METKQQAILWESPAADETNWLIAKLHTLRKEKVEAAQAAHQEYVQEILKPNTAPEFVASQHTKHTRSFYETVKKAPIGVNMTPADEKEAAAAGTDDQPPPSSVIYTFSETTALNILYKEFEDYTPLPIAFPKPKKPTDNKSNPATASTKDSKDLPQKGIFQYLQEQLDDALQKKEVEINGENFVISSTTSTIVESAQQKPELNWPKVNKKLWRALFDTDPEYNGEAGFKTIFDFLFSDHAIQGAGIDLTRLRTKPSQATGNRRPPLHFYLSSLKNYLQFIHDFNIQPQKAIMLLKNALPVRTNEGQWLLNTYILLKPSLHKAAMQDDALKEFLQNSSTAYDHEILSKLQKKHAADKDKTLAEHQALFEDIENFRRYMLNKQEVRQHEKNHNAKTDISLIGSMTCMVLSQFTLSYNLSAGAFAVGDLTWTTLWILTLFSLARHSEVYTQHQETKSLEALKKNPINEEGIANSTAHFRGRFFTASVLMAGAATRSLAVNKSHGHQNFKIARHMPMPTFIAATVLIAVGLMLEKFIAYQRSKKYLSGTEQENKAYLQNLKKAFLASTLCFVGPTIALGLLYSHPQIFDAHQQLIGSLLAICVGISLIAAAWQFVSKEPGFSKQESKHSEPSLPLN